MVVILTFYFLVFFYKNWIFLELIQSRFTVPALANVPIKFDIFAEESAWSVFAGA
jgi:hypothetical protein